MSDAASEPVIERAQYLCVTSNRFLIILDHSDPENGGCIAAWVNDVICACVVAIPLALYLLKKNFLRETFPVQSEMRDEILVLKSIFRV